MNARSATFSTQVPPAGSPLNVESGCAGVNEPCHGLPAAVMFWIEVAAESSSVVRQKLFPLSPIRRDG